MPATDEVTVFVYNASGQLVAEYSTEISQTPKVSYTTADYLGSPRILTDENGATISRRDFHPFGEEVFTSERTAGLGYTADDVRQKFTSYERDTETDLDFAQARYHSANLGRFSSPDPYNVILEKERGEDEDERAEILIGFISNSQRWNLYVYVVNNPLSFTDPDGQKPRTINVFLDASVASQEELRKWQEWAASAQKKDKNLTVNILTVGKDGSANKFLESLKAKDTTTVFMGHSYGQMGIAFGGSTIGNSQDSRRGRVTNTADGIDIQNAVLAVFSCNFGNGFKDITSSNGTAFVSIVQGQEPGAHPTTYAPAVNAAAFRFAQSIAAGTWSPLLLPGELNVARAQGQSGINAFPHPTEGPMVNAGDRVDYRILPPPRKRR